MKLDKYQAIFLFSIVTLGFLTYANTLRSPFIFDDLMIIKDNPSIRMAEIDWKNLNTAISGLGSNRPVSTLSFALNYYFNQYNLLGYHLVNIIVHIVTGILLYFLLKNTLNISGQQNLLSIDWEGKWSTILSGLAALLWLASPIQTQSVTYIVQRTNSMAAMFYILALLFYIKGRLAHRHANHVDGDPNDSRVKRKPWRYYYFWYLGCAVAGILAFGSKENTVSLPFFIFLYEWYFFQNLSRTWFKKKLIFIAAPVVLLCLVALVQLGMDPWEKFKNLRDFSEGQFTVGQRLLTQARVVVYYISLIFYPHPSRLNLDYDFPLSQSLLDPLTTLPALIIIAGLVALSFILAPKQRLLSFCIVWFLGNLVIESSIIPLAIIFEHRLYLPSMLVFQSAVFLAYRYIKPFWLPLTIVGVLIAVSTYWTFERNTVWQTRISIWTDCVLKAPNKARPYANLGNAQKAQNRDEEAEQNYRKAIDINPELVEAHNNLGVLLEEQSNTGEAIRHYLTAVQIKPGFADGHNNLGSAYQKHGDRDKAEKHIRRALEINPNHAKAHNNIGFILATQGRLDEAIEHYRKALQINPDLVEAHSNFGHALQQQGHLDEAVKRYRRALTLNPDYADARFRLAEALIMLGKSDQAVDHIQKALQIKPDDAEALNNLGGQLLRRGELDKAFKYLTQALKINPELAQAHNNVGIILIRQGDLDRAILHFRQAVRLDPDFELARNNLRKALALHGGLNRETAEIQKLIDTRPNDPELRFKMGNIYLGKGDFSKAVAEFEIALALRPDYLEAQNNLAMAYAANRQYDQAQAAFKKLVELDPANAGNYYNIAVIYALQNRVPESITWLQKAIDQGYQNWALIKTDKDLANIRDSEEYKQLVKGR